VRAFEKVEKAVKNNIAHMESLETLAGRVFFQAPPPI
jgi:hypothetical protein